jgi:hypothetical protein
MRRQIEIKNFNLTVSPCRLPNCQLENPFPLKVWTTPDPYLCKQQDNYN